MTSISLPVETFICDGDFFAAIRFPESTLSIIENARTATKARAKLKSAAQAALLKAAECERHNSLRVIGCKDGTVLLVRWNPDCREYEYRIAGEGRSNMSVTFGAMPDFQAALASARSHAESSYGGILWENY